MKVDPPINGQPTPDPSQGGSGGCAPGIRTTRLVERALREEWPIPEKLRPRLVKRLAKILVDKTTSPREATSAAKAILAASKLNLEAIATTMKAEEHEQLVERLDELEKRMPKCQ